MGWSMSDNYGFRLSTFTLAARINNRGERGHDLPLDTINGPEGAFGLFRDALQSVQTEGVLRDGESHHEILAIHEGSNHRFLLCVVLGGKAGEAFQLRDHRGERTGQVRRQDAMTWPGRVLYVFPTGSSTTGFQVQETRGRQSHGVSTNDRLVARLKQDYSILASFTHDVADGAMWTQILKSEEAELNALEFKSLLGDGAGYSEELGAKSLAVKLSVDPKREKTLEIFRVIGSLMSKRQSLAPLLNAVGGVPHQQSLEGGSATARMVVDGSSRSIQINGRSNWFVRLFDSEGQPDNREFLHEAGRDILELQGPLSVTLDAHPLPTSGIPDEIEPDGNASVA